MEICFKLATERAVKVLIALFACISIAYTVTRTDSYIRLLGAVIIGLIAVVLRTSKTLPLCQLTCSHWVTLCHHVWYGICQVHQGSGAPCHIDKNPWQAISLPTQATQVHTYNQSDGGTLPLGTQQRPSWAPPGSGPLSTMQWWSLHDSSGRTAGLPCHCSRHNYSQPQGATCQQHLCLQGMVNIHDYTHPHTQPICSLCQWRVPCCPRWPYWRPQHCHLKTACHPHRTTYAQISQPDLNNNITISTRNQSQPSTCHLQAQAGKVLHFCTGCRCAHLWGNDGDDWNQAHSQLWEHDACMARMEILSPPLPYVEQLKGSLDGCICGNAQHQPHDLWRLGLRQTGTCTGNCPGREDGCIAGQLGKHVHPEEQYNWQAGRSKPATGKNHPRSHWGHRTVEDWQSIHGTTIRVRESVPLEIHQARLGPNWVLLDSWFLG